MELRHLRYFLAVAEELSFRRAAEKLHIAQPPLSAQIRALEEELGARLFDRTTRSVRLTHAGRVMLEDARNVLGAAAQAQQRAREAAQGIVGTLRLGMVAPVANAWLAAILRRFRQQYPKIQFSLFSLTSVEQLHRLRAGELDFGLLRPPVSSPELDFKSVGQAQQLLVMPKGHPLASKPQLRWSDFDNVELVLVHPSAQHGLYDPFFDQCAKAGVHPRIIQYANDIQTKMWLISAGFGVAPTTATMDEVGRPGMVFRPLPPGLPPVQTVLVWRRDNLSPALEHFRKSFRPFNRIVARPEKKAEV